jgi:hypothetical protein
MGQPNRSTFNISLRHDDPFERRLSSCLKRMPRGYGKMFFHRVARLFGRDCKTDDELYQMMLDFVFEVKPLRLAAMPDVAAEYDGGKAAIVRAEAPPPARQQPLFQREELGVDL